MRDLIFDPPEVGCVLYLTGLPQSGDKIIDRSPYGNTGTITGASWRSNGSIWYLNFDKVDDTINCGKNSSLDILAQITMKCWIRPTAASLIGAPAVMGKWWDGVKRAYRIYINVGKIAVSLGAADGGGDVDGVFDTTLTASVWKQVIVTWNHVAVSCFLNGIAEATTYAKSTNTAVNTSNFYIGTTDGTADDYGGDIALYELSNLGWSTTQVVNSFNRERHLFGV